MSDWNAMGEPQRPQTSGPGTGPGGPGWATPPGGPAAGRPGWAPTPAATGWSGQPGGPGGAGGPARAAPARRGGLLLGVVIGLVVAVVVGAVLTLTKVVRFGAATATTTEDTRGVSLPDSLAGLDSYATAVTARATAGGGRAAGVLATNQHMISLTQAAYQKAFAGAATTAKSYATSDLMGIFTVVAVRANAPGLVGGPVSDPADLGLARNIHSVETVGDMQCDVVSTAAVVAGKTVDPATLLTAVCQRTGSGLTVWAYGSGVTGPQGEARITALVDAAYAAAGAS